MRAAGLVCAVMAFMLLPGTAGAATISPDIFTDEVTAGNGDCSLREAVLLVDGLFPAANDCGTAAGDGSDVIQLAAGTYKLTLIGPGPGNTGGGDLDVLKGVTIIGVAMATTIIDASNDDDDAIGNGDRVITSSAPLTLQKLTVRGGLVDFYGGGIYSDAAALSLDEARVTANKTGDAADDSGGLSGGGIYFNGGASNASLSVVDSTIDFNATGAGGDGVTNFGGSYYGGLGGGGAGIYVNTGGSLDITDSVIADNKTGAGGDATGTAGTTAYGGTGGNGAGLHLNTAGPAELLRVQLTRNETGPGGTATGGDTNYPAPPGTGGGLYEASYSGGSLTITDSDIASNKAGGGGGFAGYAATTVLDSSTVRDNESLLGGGGFVLSKPTVVNSTFSGNRAVDGGDLGGGIGGGLYSYGGDTIQSSTFAYNTAAFVWAGIVGSSTTTITNSIVSDGGAANQCAGNLTDGGGNVSWDGTAGDPSCPGIQGDPLLTALALNGGNTLNHLFQSGSVAYGNATGPGCPGVDQRDVLRPQFSVCDSGSVETTDEYNPFRPSRRYSASTMRRQARARRASERRVMTRLLARRGVSIRRVHRGRCQVVTPRGLRRARCGHHSWQLPGTITMRRAIGLDGMRQSRARPKLRPGRYIVETRKTRRGHTRKKVERVTIR